MKNRIIVFRRPVFEPEVKQPQEEIGRERESGRQISSLMVSGQSGKPGERLYNIFGKF